MGMCRLVGGGCVSFCDQTTFIPPRPGYWGLGGCERERERGRSYLELENVVDGVEFLLEPGGRKMVSGSSMQFECIVVMARSIERTAVAMVCWWHRGREKRSFAEEPQQTERDSAVIGLPN